MQRFFNEAALYTVHRIKYCKFHNSIRIDLPSTGVLANLFVWISLAALVDGTLCAIVQQQLRHV